MTTLFLRDGAGKPIYVQVSGAGTKTDPFALGTTSLYTLLGAHFSVPTATLATVYTATKPAGANGLLVQNVGTSPVRLKMDGVDPTTTTGFQLPASMQTPIFIDCPGANLRIIRESAGAALEGQWAKK